MQEKYEIGQTRLEVNVFDGEMIVLNLESGCYYSIEGSGQDIWAMIDVGLTVDQMATALADNYDIAKETIRAEIQSFCGKLLDEDVLIASNVDTIANTAEFSDFRPEFEPASISKYDDLVDSFALDPPLVIGSI